ncbi:sugar transferase [Idiomarina seosinensis]|uniref:sugar transferase n=1 Tax=Idiomarina seosinensis TaxID=281739 RepID=UPI0038515CA0
MLLKRTFDIIVSTIGLLLLLPVMVLLMLLVRIKVGSPIFFRQKRPGLNENAFYMLKFRTMTDERDDEGKLLPDEIRLTPFGSFLRKTSLDELPELVNILKGEMSFVGPRPLLFEYLHYYSEKEKLRHSVRPGLTGLAQISGRNHVKWDQRLALDVKYVEEWSFWLDVKILFKTALQVMSSKDVVVVPSSKFGKLSEERDKKK